MAGGGKKDCTEKGGIKYVKESRSVRNARIPSEEKGETPGTATEEEWVTRTQEKVSGTTLGEIWEKKKIGHPTGRYEKKKSGYTPGQGDPPLIQGRRVTKGEGNTKESSYGANFYFPSIRSNRGL